jgi:predicted nucleotidyltransferase
VKIEEMKRILAEHKNELREQYHVQSIGIFGSYVRGDQRPESDLDILVEFDKPTSPSDGKLWICAITSRRFSA